MHHPTVHEPDYELIVIGTLEILSAPAFNWTHLREHLHYNF